VVYWVLKKVENDRRERAGGGGGRHPEFQGRGAVSGFPGTLTPGKKRKREGFPD